MEITYVTWNKNKVRYFSLFDFITLFHGLHERVRIQLMFRKVQTQFFKVFYFTVHPLSPPWPPPLGWPPCAGQPPSFLAGVCLAHMIHVRVENEMTPSRSLCLLQKLITHFTPRLTLAHFLENGVIRNIENYNVKTKWPCTFVTSNNKLLAEDHPVMK